MDYKKMGIPDGYTSKPYGERGPILPDAIKSPEQNAAELILGRLVEQESEAVFVSNQGHSDLDYLISSRGRGQWGLLLTESASKYRLWYLDYQGDQKGEIKTLLLDLSREDLVLVANCLKDEIVDTATVPKRKTEKATKAEKLAKLIQGASGVFINNIDDESGFTSEYKVSLSSLLGKGK